MVEHNRERGSDPQQVDLVEAVAVAGFEMRAAPRPVPASA
jgi:hypothetical protein